MTSETTTNVIRRPAIEPISRDKIWEAFVAYLPTIGAILSEDGFDLVKNAIEEMERFRVELADHWYVRNVYRFQKMRETDRRMARYALKRFVADIATRKVRL